MGLGGGQGWRVHGSATISHLVPEGQITCEQLGGGGGGGGGPGREWIHIPKIQFPQKKLCTHGQLHILDWVAGRADGCTVPLPSHTLCQEDSAPVSSSSEVVAVEEDL
ncbi:hypothetical protein Y032_0014g2411 [Ancylostoma ceylanicum]|uniref:Uncharacterized protein n=1 Tax=Ancylostoma ceylanicum TaxID=53326 RepID=A0A016VAH0_9BILA|nr:hypothetical protein Y032_0014g2411 [Ancylostoma ceylanicum]